MWLELSSKAVAPTVASALPFSPRPQPCHLLSVLPVVTSAERPWRSCSAVRCGEVNNGAVGLNLMTCRQCKSQFDPSRNHSRACRFHTAHFGGNPRSWTLLPKILMDSSFLFSFWLFIQIKEK
ncbi:uncharacterized protein LOC18428080 isoform X2 [Amborella trichopoda]|uniref:uncharacterized protein LOC18428080 isoform X2 n=1 Tax=Amborella trichopoda TaxID=13333 RepID=UPI0005D3C283|nr:uncharacterized protein LOC18428080 isoform X2 [Amborella trichopoda]|eukprot:XP_011621139.1 uncharacterized protein LOC18428080 isoform X2 [Amborella trichopoda]